MTQQREHRETSQTQTRKRAFLYATETMLNIVEGALVAVEKEEARKPYIHAFSVCVMGLAFHAFEAIGIMGVYTLTVTVYPHGKVIARAMTADEEWEVSGEGINRVIGKLTESVEIKDHGLLVFADALVEWCEQVAIRAQEIEEGGD